MKVKDFGYYYVRVQELSVRVDVYSALVKEYSMRFGKFFVLVKEYFVRFRVFYERGVLLGFWKKV